MTKAKLVTWIAPLLVAVGAICLLGRRDSLVVASPDGSNAVDCEKGFAYVRSSQPGLFRGTMVLGLDAGEIVGCAWKNHQTVVVRVSHDAVIPSEFVNQRRQDLSVRIERSP